MKDDSEKKKMFEFEETASKSLDEVNGSIAVPDHAGFWKTLFTYTGPGILIAVVHGSRKLDHVNCRGRPV